MHFFQHRWWHTPSRTVKQFLTNLTYLLVSTDTNFFCTIGQNHQWSTYVALFLFCFILGLSINNGTWFFSRVWKRPWFSEIRVQIKRLSKGREGVNNRRYLDNTVYEQLMIEIEINSIEVYHRILLQKSIYPLFSCLHKSSIRLINISMNETSPFILFKIADIEMYREDIIVFCTYS